MEFTIIFSAIVVIFIFTGLARGFRRELGVTIALMLVLSLIQLAEGVFKNQATAILTWAISGDAIYRAAMRGLLWSAMVVLVVFFAYQTNIFSFPGEDNPLVLNAGAGLLNGYLLAGSVWYFLAQAGWPYMKVPAAFDQLYLSAARLLPPSLLIWPAMALMAGAMLALRLWDRSRV